MYSLGKSKTTLKYPCLFCRFLLIFLYFHVEYITIYIRQNILSFTGGFKFITANFICAVDPWQQILIAYTINYFLQDYKFVCKTSLEQKNVQPFGITVIFLVGINFCNLILRILCAMIWLIWKQLLHCSCSFLALITQREDSFIKKINL